MGFSGVSEKLRIAIGALLFEGNTLSPVRTTLDDVRNKYLARGREVLELADSEIEIAGALQVLNSIDAEIVPLLATHGGAVTNSRCQRWARPPRCAPAPKSRAA